MLLFLIVLVIFGFVVGALARFALPGPDPMPWYTTIGLGLAGTFVGGIVARVVFGTAEGFIFALAGAVLLLGLYRKYVQKRPVFRAR